MFSVQLRQDRQAEGVLKISQTPCQRQHPDPPESLPIGPTQVFKPRHALGDVMRPGEAGAEEPRAPGLGKPRPRAGCRL